MLVIKEYDEIINSDGKNYDATSFNGKLFWAYRNSKDAGNEMLNFDDNCSENDIEQIAKLLRKFAITEFTISSTWSSLLETLASFDEKGIKMQGIVRVYEHTNCRQRKKIPAILMRVE
ncbi:MAG: hypothetical protein IJ859_00165 [Synergistaceae bacterium]|nr:hypothetical protein [Synergistaceae bacterium]